MAYTALYREWRPKKFDDVVGQEYITTTLKNQILNNRIAHAYLFCGTRGTGKTSTAKIMAKALNCLNLQDGEPCNECEMCKKISSSLAIDITEIDAASNNKVEQIRDIIDEVQYPPQEANFKVYIMDEVHMLSIGAVNAFLKTLEEPPKNVVFILATTDPQKLPITILSRCQRFDFKRISNKQISERLRKIVMEQGVLADDRSLNLIAKVSDGAMRDSLSILDQAISIGDGKIEYNKIIDMLGIVTNEHLFKVTDAIIEKNIEHVITTIDDVVLLGKDIHLFIKDLIEHYRNLLMLKVTNNPEEVLDMSLENIQLLKTQGDRIRVEEIMRAIRILQEAEESSKISKQSRLYLELAAIKICKIEYDTSKEVLLARINKLEEIIKNGKIKVATLSKEDMSTSHSNNIVKETTKKAIEKKENSINLEDNFNENCKIILDDVKRMWKDILEQFKNRRAMVLYASLMTGKPISCENGIIVLEYDSQYSFNKIRLEKIENSKIVNEIFSEILKDNVRVRYSIINDKEDEKSNEQLLIEALGDELEVLDE